MNEEIGNQPILEDSVTTEQELPGISNVEHGCDVPPPLKSLVKYKLKDKDEWNVVRIVKRGGRAGGKNQHWYNVYDRDSDSGEMYSLNWQAVDTWNVVPEE